MKQSIRGSDVFVKEDIRSVLQALLATNETLATMAGADVQQYRYGFAAGWLAATSAMRTAIGIRTASPLDDWRVVDEPQIVEVRP